MAREEYSPPVKEFLDMLVNMLAERYFERMDGRLKKIPELKRLITVKEASQYLNVSTETIYKMAASKKLPYLKIGERVLFDLKFLDQWIERRMIREKEWKMQELNPEIEKEKPSSKVAKESNLLNMLKKE
jgi:excisionase family DNA binding protein